MIRRNHWFIILLLLQLLAVTSPCTHSNQPLVSEQSELKKSDLTVTYIANEGVLISSGEKQVLIDGLHREYKPDYAFPPGNLLNSLESAVSPYNEIDLILVSHVHLDHFHPQSLGLHLQNNPNAVLVSSDQIADALAKEFSDFIKIKRQVKRVAHQWKSQVTQNEAGIGLKLLGLRHAGQNFSWVQNFGYVVQVDGRKLLHIGDADMTNENFSSFNLTQEKIDIAFIPYWYLLSSSGRALVEEKIQPKLVIAVHIPPADATEVTERIRAVFPEAITFTRVLETRAFNE